MHVRIKQKSTIKYENSKVNIDIVKGGYSTWFYYSRAGVDSLWFNGSGSEMGGRYKRCNDCTIVDRMCFPSHQFNVTKEGLVILGQTPTGFTQLTTYIRMIAPFHISRPRVYFSTRLTYVKPNSERDFLFPLIF